MKKLYRAIFSLVLMLLVVTSLTVTAFAQSTQSGADIVYKGRNKLFIAPKTKEFTTTDLFGKFKGVMPGDTLKETITFKNETATSRSRYVKLYIQALAHGEKKNPPVAETAETVATMTEFLSRLSMKVWNGAELIYEASPDELDGLAEPKLLGTFRKGETATLTVELTVPLELDNDFANRLGEVDWKFTAEEYTSGGGKPTVTPGTLIQTGQLNWPIAVLAAAGGVLIALGWVILRKKRHGNA